MFRMLKFEHVVDTKWMEFYFVISLKLYMLYINLHLKHNLIGTNHF